MKFKVSYFARIRKFAPNEIPVSTAMWDPKWFHPARKPKGVYIDKRGVINGLRCDPFVPTNSCCPGPRNCLWSPDKCNASMFYWEQLSKLTYGEVMNRFADLERRLREKFDHLSKFDELTFVFIVYEKPDNECSERYAIIRWFEHWGFSLPEWEPEHEVAPQC